jgi:hypothetical protein
MSAFVIGVDPGRTTGICVLGLGPAFDNAAPWIDEHPQLLQCTPGAVSLIVRAYLARIGTGDAVLAIERFVVGPRASRSSSAKTGETTRELIGALVDLGARLDVRVVQRSASEVKPWATNKRLEAAGLLVKGMPHAQDAGRHALYAAVKDAGLPDPLSRTTRSAPRRTT